MKSSPAAAVDHVRMRFVLGLIMSVLILIFSGFAFTQSRQNEPRAAIRAVLDAQVAAWNRGDLEGYMDGYERSPDIVFISGDRVTRGWQTVLDRYKKSYDTREKMGVLTFSDVEITLLSKDTVLVFGRWQLRAKGDPRGRFTLLFRRTRDGWRIVHDHTSSA